MALSYYLILTDKESADALQKRLWTRYYSKKLPRMSYADFVLKVVGVGEYLVGDNPLSSFEYVQKRLEKCEPIELVLFERANISDHFIQEDEVLEEQWQQGGEEVCEYPFSVSFPFSLFAFLVLVQSHGKLSA
jgi:hypothetical protein